MPRLAGENSGRRFSPYDQRVLVYVEAVAGTFLTAENAAEQLMTRTFLTAEKAAGQLVTANDGG